MKSTITLALVLGAACLRAQMAEPLRVQPPNQGSYTVENVAELNTPFLDYCALPYRDGAVFTSARGGKGVFVCDQDLVTGRYSDLYFAKEDAEGHFFYPDMMHGNLNGKYHDGAVTFSPDGLTMIFSRNNQNGQNSAGLIDLKIYSAEKKNGKWANVQELPLNSNDFATCHPSLSADGQILFFASNRPGGYGGMDIFAVKKQGAQWGTPVNLGPEVNSSGNDIFPFVSASNTLYFSSDGRPGLGGLDVFACLLDGLMPSQPFALSAPVNSPADDFGFTADPAEHRGFLTSDRSGGKGQDDIYRWKFSGDRPVLASVCVVEERTGRRIDDASLRIRLASDHNAWGQAAPDTEQGQEAYVVLYTEAYADPTLPFARSCGIKVPVMPGENYRVEVTKPGYAPVSMLVTAGEMLALPEFLVPILPTATTVFTGSVRNRLTDGPLAASSVNIRNRCTGEVVSLRTDASGSFHFDLDCRCAYEVLATKEGFGQNEKQWQVGEIDCQGDAPVMAIYLAPADDRAPLEVGTVIELENVYYDYDQSFIRKDAAVDLDHVVGLLRQYPSLEIELGSHTDARGSAAYNEALSQQRAEAAVQYIVSKGIDARRLSARGYGETKLVNHCADDVACAEEEHQRNRRTEIKITRLEEKGVKKTW